MTLLIWEIDKAVNEADASGESMIPDELKRKCKRGDHLWKVSKENPQRFQGGASTTEYTCVLCRKKNIEVD